MWGLEGLVDRVWGIFLRVMESHLNHKCRWKIWSGCHVENKEEQTEEGPGRPGRRLVPWSSDR